MDDWQEKSGRQVIKHFQKKGIAIGNNMARDLVSASKEFNVEITVKGLCLKNGLPKVITISVIELKELLDDQ